MANAYPNAYEAEVRLLGTMLVSNEATRTTIEEGLSEDDFYEERHRYVYRAIKQLYNEGEAINTSSITTRLNDLNLGSKCGGEEYLLDLMSKYESSERTKDYIKLIRDKSMIRNMIKASEIIAKDGLDGQPNVDDYLDNAEKMILNVSRNRKAGTFKAPEEYMGAVLNQIRSMQNNTTGITGLKTGLTGLDDTLHGLQRGDMIVLAARPSMGKTAVALNLALNVAQYNKGGAVAIFSLEMGAEQLGMRLLSAQSKVKGDSLKTGNLNDDEWNRINESVEDLKDLELYIDDTPETKVGEIFAKCRRLKAEHGLNLVLIDYIQLISGNGNGRGEANRQQEVSDISRSLKGLARELEVPVVALSQLSRSVEQRENKHPMLSDLRESGAIEQDADVVMMLYREAYYNDEAKQKAEEEGTEKLEINVAKHRNGATRKVFVAFEGATNALYNIAYTSDSE